jgi:hypothetical protein
LLTPDRPRSIPLCSQLLVACDETRLVVNKKRLVAATRESHFCTDARVEYAELGLSEQDRD